MTNKNDTWFSPYKPGEPPMRTCERCGTPFKPRTRNQRFCSRDCRVANYKPIRKSRSKAVVNNA